MDAPAHKPETETPEEPPPLTGAGIPRVPDVTKLPAPRRDESVHRTLSSALVLFYSPTTTVNATSSARLTCFGPSRAGWEKYQCIV